MVDRYVADFLAKHLRDESVEVHTQNTVARDGLSLTMAIRCSLAR